MGPKKVFDIWGSNATQGNYMYAPAGMPATPGKIFSDFLPAKRKAAVKEVVVEPEPEPVVENSRLSQWKKAVVEKRSSGTTPPESPEEKPDEPKKSVPFWKHWYVAVTGVVLVALVGLAVYIFPLHRSLAPVYLSNIKISPTASSPDLQKQISSGVSGYNLAIRDTAGKVNKFPLNKTGISIDVKTSVKHAKADASQDWLGRLSFWKPIKLQLVAKTDKDVFQNFLHENVIKPNVAYQNANLNIDGSSVSISSESAGQGQTEANPYIDLPAAVASLNTKPIQLQKLSIPAPIRKADLTDERTKLENILNQKITLSIDGNSVIVKPADIASWLDLSPVEHAKTVDISINSGKVLAYLNKMAGYYITPPRSRLVMSNADGSKTVLDAGKSGVDIVNKDKTASDIAQKVMAAKGLDQNLDVSYADAKTVEVQPYDKWIVVDVTAKRMYAYEQTNLVHSFLISSGAPQTPTVLGAYSIYSKYASQDMRGNNADGSRYFQPDVQWVNYFYKDYAVHGNYWRPLSWFGNINSSHGCVGVVNDDAKWIYDWAPIGTPVIVHS